MPANNDDILQALLANAQSREPAAAPRRRRRGGLAGIWDRNKNIIKPVVSGALGLVPGIGMGLAAGAGALMGGLDREGRGGIGFDAGQGVRGGLSGAAAGGVAQMGRAGLTRVLGGAPNAASVGGAGAGANLAPTAAPGQSIATATGRVSGTAYAPLAATAPDAVSSAVPLPTSRAGMQVSGGAASGGMMRGLGRVGSFVNNNANAVGMGLQGVSGILGAQSERRIAEERIALERERYEEERRRRENIARMLLPLYQQQAARFNP